MARHRRAIQLLGTSFLVLALAHPALAGSRIEKNLTLGPGGKLVLDTEAGSVSVSGSTEAGVHVVVTSRSDDLEKRYKFEFQEAPGEVRITGKKADTGWLRGISVHFEIRAPRATSLSLRTSGGSIEASGLAGTADVDTSGGSISIDDLEGALKAHTSGGSITLREIKGDVRVETSGGSINASSIAGSLDARTSGGHVDVENVTGDAVLRTSGGSVKARNAGGRVIAKTSGGSIEVSFARGNARGGELETAAGSVEVTVDPSASLTVDATTSAGRISTDFPLQVTGSIGSSSVHGTIGKGGESLTIHTSAGSIELRSLK
ncbi:MAG: DUF4097 family beta strand repeat-containing protein [Acidobacteriia bacterium]|nr:DUF4097 family beta strand repeat-containing protein [Terriglobia bacterium]